MNIYLAGKVDATNGAWRDALLGKVYVPEARRYAPRWELVRNWDHDLNRAAVPPDWPTAPNTFVLDLHNYVGPYRVTYHDSEGSNKSTGYFHGTTWIGAHGQMEDGDKAEVVHHCKEAIQRSDLVFAYINTPDCFATLAEIGYAVALQKYVHVLVEEYAEWEYDDYWWIGQLVDQYVSGHWWHIEHPDCAEDFGGGPCGRPHRGDPADFIRDRFRDAIVQWTGRPNKPAPLALVQKFDNWEREAATYGESFYQIYKWTADPRVRNEAARMVERIRQVVGR